MQACKADEAASNDRWKSKPTRKAAPMRRRSRRPLLMRHASRSLLTASRRRGSSDLRNDQSRPCKKRPFWQSCRRSQAGIGAHFPHPRTLAYNFPSRRCFPEGGPSRRRAAAYPRWPNRPQGRTYVVSADSGEAPWACQCRSKNPARSAKPRLIALTDWPCRSGN